MDTAEGTRRLAKVIRFIGDGVGILCLIGGIAGLIAFGEKAMLVVCLICGAFIAACGRAISWVLEGYAK